MTIKQFRALDLNGQADAVWGGTFLESRVDAKYGIQIYNVHNFYVQVYYSRNLNEIVKIMSFKNTLFIQPYLDSIDIHKL